MIRSIALVLLCASAACSQDAREPTESSPAEQQRAAIDPAPAPTVFDPACPTSRGGERDDVLTGRCLDGAQCAMTTPGGLTACKPGMQIVPPAPTDWECTCLEARWQCESPGRGFGVLSCPGTDGGAQ